eukprot:6214250-Ditylum_brightwellii.AAC.1
MTTQMLVNLCEDFNMMMPKSGAKPVCIEDILMMVGNKDWHNKDIEKARNQLWMMQYSIFKMDYNDWMKTFEKEWSEQHNL